MTSAIGYNGTMHTSKYKQGDLVMFANRVQNCTTGMVVQSVDSNMFDSRLKVNDLWWTEDCFMPFTKWKQG